MVKKKPAKKKKALAAQELDREEVRDELLALEAIFGPEDFEARPEGSGFSLRVVPHPGQAEANHVSVKLVVRCAAALAGPLSGTARWSSEPAHRFRILAPALCSYPRAYPQEELILKLAEAQGLAGAAVKALSKALHGAAAAAAAEGEACCFQLATLCQELLQQYTVPPSDDDDDGAAPAQPLSLWHEMQRREAEPSAEPDPLAPAPSGGGAAFNAFDWADGGLFSDPLDVAGWAAPAAAPLAPAARLPKPPRPPPPAQRTAAPAEPTLVLPPASSGPALVASTAAAGPGGAAAEASLRRPSPYFSGAAGGAKSGMALEASASGSMANTMLTAVRQSFSALGRAMLPRQLRRMMDGEA